MPTKTHRSIVTLFLILVVCVNFLNVRSVRADGETPTEPPAATEVSTESTPEPVAATATPAAELLPEVPEGTEVVVLDENGESVPLASAEAAEITDIVDPMWCPAGVLPGGAGCSASYSTISALVNNMRTNPSGYDEAGVIYFTANPGSQSFTLTDGGTSLGTSYDTLKNYNLTLQGGWDGSTTSYSGQTNFGTRPMTIGTSTNPWVGNLTLNDFVFSATSSTALTIYTSTGNIALNNVDVNNQSNGGNTALLNSTSGNITVNDGTYDGNRSGSTGNSSGFSATTGGSISVSNSSFTDNIKPSTATANGANLTAPVVTLVNVTATNNDGSGVFFTGASLFINGGTYSNNQRYGVEVADPASATIYLQSAPTCLSNTLGCYNDATVSDNTAPSITPNVNGTAGLNGWYTSDVAVSWSVSDAESGIKTSSNCTDSNLTGNTTGTTLTCSATNNMGLSNSVSVTIKIDKTAPVLSLPANISTQASGPAAVSYSASASDNFDGSMAANCSPASGSTFPVGTTTVNCYASDTAGNVALGSFDVTVVDTTVVTTPTSPAPTATASPSGTSTTGSSNPQSNSQSNSSSLTIPITGGEVINLNCDSAFSVFGIKLVFVNLCDYQTTLHSIHLDSLPGQLPTGYSFVMGLDLTILSENQKVETLPNGASVQMDFPISGAKDQFAVLHWNGTEWTEVSQQANDEQGFYQVTTADQTGIFVLVKK